MNVQEITKMNDESIIPYNEFCEKLSEFLQLYHVAGYTHEKNYESVYRMKLTGYQVRTAIGILNERRLALKSQGCTLENSETNMLVYLTCSAVFLI